MSYRFLRYLRFGVASGIAQVEGDATATARASFQAQLEIAVNGASRSFQTPALQVAGPGDITRLDARQVLRRVPQPGAAAAPADEFASIEFARADLPWLFTPFAPSAAADTLKPWIGLVVVRQDAVTIEAGVPNPVLTIKDAAALAELPSLDATTQAWAHVQLSDSTSQDDLVDLASKHPERFISRLICPRRLAGRTMYWACVVPVFEGGRAAGLGLPAPATDAAALAPAWSPTTTLPWHLPVFDAWEFTTGEAGSFADLARRLQPRTLTGGTRPMDATRPGGGIPDPAAGATAVVVNLDGALSPGVPTTSSPPPALAAAIQAQLSVPNAVTAPCYGRWHAAAPPDLPPTVPDWLREINIDPVRRAAAGLGTQVVQAHQEEFMAAAWEQVGEVLRANQLLRLGEFAQAAATRLYERRLAVFRGAGAGADLELVALAGPMMARIRVDGSTTLRGAVRRSCLPLLALSGAFRKMTRVTGPIGRRLRRSTDRPLLRGPLLGRLALGDLRDPGPPPPSGGIVLSREALDAVFPPRRGQPAEASRRLGKAASVIQAVRARAARTVCTPFDPARVLKGLTAQMNPRVTVPARVRAQLEIPQGVWQPAVGLAPAMVSPHLPWPMYKPLAELDRNWLLPGLGDVPVETITVARPNSRFIEAYMAGLNHEMGRELLWRHFPTDQRGTVFDRFWSAEAAEIAAMDGWSGSLGGHGVAARNAQLVVLMRGELVRRFPGASVYLQRARVTNGTRAPEPTMDPANTALPLFGGWLDPDVRFLGFPVPAESAKGGAAAPPADAAGYYVVIQERPGDLRFGPSSASPTSLFEPASPSGGPLADATAVACYLQPYRLYIHADQLIV